MHRLRLRNGYLSIFVLFELCVICVEGMKLIVMNKKQLQAPNGMGTLFGVAQIIVYATFYRSTKAMKAQPQQELALSQKQLPGPHTNV